jgi:uncharacterized protein (TIGR03067 family)
MKRTVSAGLAVSLLFAAGLAPAGQQAKEEAPVSPELAKFQGQWAYESVLEDGKEVGKDVLKKRTIFFGGDRVLVKDGDELTQLATQRIDPKTPGTVDLTVVAGPNKGVTMLGIYEFKGNTLRVCFDTQGSYRPMDFKAKGEGLMVAVYKRDKAAEDPEIVGVYQCEGVELDGNKYSSKVEIQRLGEAYSVRWSKGVAQMHVGVGVRKGNLLSVSFLNKSMAGIVVYQIGKDRKLHGEWTEFGGIGILRTETLTPKE